MPTNDRQLVNLLFETAQRAKEWMGPRRRSGSGAITHVRLATLKFIQTQPQPTMKDLAAHLHIAAPSATLLVDSLVAKKLLRRVDVAGDRRSVRLALTPKGTRALAQAYRDVCGRISTVIAHLTLKERAQLKAMLARLVRFYATKKSS